MLKIATVVPAFGLALLLLSALHAEAQQRSQQSIEDEARRFLAHHCPPPRSDRPPCEKEQASFIADYKAAMRGDYQGQRNVAFCLREGCYDTIAKNNVQACAWRMVVLQSGHAEVYQGDTENAEYACGKLTATERTAAAARTVAIMGEIAAAKRR